jgi:ankyrin repeat protein
MINLLLDRGAKMVAEGERRWTPLFWAAGANNAAAIGALVDRGASVTARDSAGNTPLHQAAFNLRADAVAELVKAKAEVNTVNARGRTPLHLALQTAARRPNGAKVSEDIVRLLVEEGARLDIADYRGETAADVLAQKDALKPLRDVINRASRPTTAKSQ